MKQNLKTLISMINKSSKYKGKIIKKILPLLVFDIGSGHYYIKREKEMTIKLSKDIIFQIIINPDWQDKVLFEKNIFNPDQQLFSINIPIAFKTKEDKQYFITSNWEDILEMKNDSFHVYNIESIIIENNYINKLRK